MYEVFFHLAPGDFDLFRGRKKSLFIDSATSTRSLFFGLLIGFGVATLFRSLVNGQNPRLGLKDCLWMAGVAVIFFCWEIVKAWKARRKKATVDRSPVLVTVTMTALGIQSEIQSHRHYVTWDGIAEVTARDSLILISGKSGGVFIIPIRAFASHEEADEFLAAAQQFHQAAN